MIEESLSARATDHVLGKGGGIDQANARADGFGFGLGIGPPRAPPETAAVMVKTVGRIERAIVIGTFKAVHASKLGTERFLAIIGRPGAQGATGFALFIRVMQNIDVLVAFLVLARGILRCHPIAIALGVKARHVDLGFALSHHLGKVIACAPCCGDAEAEALRQPHIAQPRRRTHQRIAIRGVADRAVVIIFEANGLRGRDPVDHRHVFLFDPLQIQREQIGPETVRNRIFETGGGIALIGAKDPAPALLAHIPFRIRIPQHRVLRVGLAPVHQRRIGFGDDVLMFHRDGRDLDAQKLRRTLCMIARRRHHMLGGDHHLRIRRDQVPPLLDHLGDRHFPRITRPVISIHLPFPLDGDAKLARALGHRLRDIGRIDIAVGWVIDRAFQILGAHQRPPVLYLLRGEKLIGDAHGLGRRGIEHVFIHAVLALGHAQVTNNVEARVQAGFRFEPFVELHRIVVDMRCCIAHVEERQQSGRMPGRA